MPETNTAQIILEMLREYKIHSGFVIAGLLIFFCWKPFCEGLDILFRGRK